jgi:hypothetical protein
MSLDDEIKKPIELTNLTIQKINDIILLQKRELYSSIISSCSPVCQYYRSTILDHIEHIEFISNNELVFNVSIKEARVEVDEIYSFDCTPENSVSSFDCTPENSVLVYILEITFFHPILVNQREELKELITRIIPIDRDRYQRQLGIYVNEQYSIKIFRKIPFIGEKNMFDSIFSHICEQVRIMI